MAATPSAAASNRERRWQQSQPPTADLCSMFHGGDSLRELCEGERVSP
jgi:hypothetical protein